MLGSLRISSYARCWFYCGSVMTGDSSGHHRMRCRWQATALNLCIVLVFFFFLGRVWGIALQDDDKAGPRTTATTGDDPPALAEEISEFPLSFALV